MNKNYDYCYYCETVYDDDLIEGVYCYKYLPSDGILRACCSNKKFFICEDCYIKETNKLSELTLKVFSDYSETNIGVVNKDNVILADVDLDKLLECIPTIQVEKLKISAIDKAIEYINNLKR